MEKIKSLLPMLPYWRELNERQRELIAKGAFFRRFEQGLHQVRHCDANKGDGAGKGRDAGGQHTGQQDQRRPEGPQGDAHILGVDLAQLVRPDGLGQQEGQQQRDAADNGHSLYVVPAHAGEGAERPVVQIHDAGIVGKGHEKIRQRRADIADHHAAYD